VSGGGFSDARVLQDIGVLVLPEMVVNRAATHTQIGGELAQIADGVIGNDTVDSLAA
jgi:hypothetical protein